MSGSAITEAIMKQRLYMGALIICLSTYLISLKKIVKRYANDDNETPNDCTHSGADQSSDPE